MNPRARNLLFAFVCLLLVGVSWRTNTTLWLLFGCFAIYFVVLAWSKPPQSSRPPVPAHDVPDGVLGEYRVEGADDDVSYGLFLNLEGSRAFVDIRCDDRKSLREQQARRLFEHSATLERGVRDFRNRNKAYVARRVSYIGLHDGDPVRADVFWDPDGHTALLDLEFVGP